MSLEINGPSGIGRPILYSKRTSGQANNSGHITPGIMFTVKQHYLTSVQGA